MASSAKSVKKRMQLAIEEQQDRLEGLGSASSSSSAAADGTMADD